MRLPVESQEILVEITSVPGIKGEKQIYLPRGTSNGISSKVTIDSPMACY